MAKGRYSEILSEIFESFEFCRGFLLARRSSPSWSSDPSPRSLGERVLAGRSPPAPFV